MKRSLMKRAAAFLLLVGMVSLNLLLTPALVAAADHADSTSVADDPGADLGDAFIFLDPNDNSKVVLSMTFAGFIVPTEQLNLGYFSDSVTYRFEIENTGDAVPDRFIDVQFSPQTSRTTPQTAYVYLNGLKQGTPSFTAPTTLPTLNPQPNPFVVTNNTPNKALFFAGLADDPFYFDIAGFGRFTSSVLAGNPDPSRLQRGRDSFAGYNIHVIAVELPAASLRGSNGDIVGLNAVTLRSKATGRATPDVRASGLLYQVDRAATPAVNTALIPFSRKNEFNNATTAEDAHGQFAGSIVGTLQALGTSASNINILASVAVANGDILRLNTAIPNPSVGFGERATTPSYVGFPNGRRTGDDTIDVLMYFITNQAITTGDNVNSNDKPLQNTFPFFGTPHQPLNSGVDPTQN